MQIELHDLAAPAPARVAQLEREAELALGAALTDLDGRRRPGELAVAEAVSEAEGGRGVDAGDLAGLREARGEVGDRLRAGVARDADREPAAGVVGCWSPSVYKCA
ncbi:hypothetical protein GCM10010442_36480 [Kitasatospora kifunensis]